MNWRSLGDRTAAAQLAGLYVGPERDSEIESLLRARKPKEHRVAAPWWPGAG